MEQVISPVRKLVGEIEVPGELQPTEQALILAALATGESVQYQRLFRGL